MAYQANTTWWRKTPFCATPTKLGQAPSTSKNWKTQRKKKTQHSTTAMNHEPLELQHVDHIYPNSRGPRPPLSRYLPTQRSRWAPGRNRRVRARGRPRCVSHARPGWFFFVVRGEASLAWTLYESYDLMNHEGKNSKIWRIGWSLDSDLFDAYFSMLGLKSHPLFKSPSCLWWGVNCWFWRHISCLEATQKWGVKPKSKVSLGLSVVQHVCVTSLFNNEALFHMYTR